MKILWGFVPRQQDKSTISDMYKLILQLASDPKNIEVGYVITGNDLRFTTSFDIPDEVRFTDYPRELILEDLKKARVPLSEKKVHILDRQTISTTESVDSFLALAR